MGEPITTAVAIAGAIVWLMMGGYAFAKFVSGGKQDEPLPVAVFWFCLLLGPAAFGMVMESERKP